MERLSKEQIEKFCIEKSQVERNCYGKILTDIDADLFGAECIEVGIKKAESFYIPQIEERDKVIEDFVGGIQKLIDSGQLNIEWDSFANSLIDRVQNFYSQSIKDLKRKDANLAIPKE